MKTKLKSLAGRKALPEGEKKQPIKLFVRKSTIDYYGGIDVCKKIFYGSLNENK